MSVTDDRKTVLILDVEDRTVERQSIVVSRTAREMWDLRQSNRPSSAPKSHDTMLIGDEAFILKPRQRDLSQVVKTAIGGDQSSQLLWAPGFVSIPMFEKNTGTGFGALAGAITRGFTAWIKRVGASQTPDMILTADLAALPAPAEEATNLYPVDRVMCSTVAYPSNTPYILTFAVPRTWEKLDHYLSFYFGGPTPTAPANTSGGMFCAVFRGDGQLSLYERNTKAAGGAAWEKRWGAQLPAAIVHARSVSVLLHPYGKDRIAVRGLETVDLARATPDEIRYSLDSHHQSGSLVYRDNLSQTGHAHTAFATGAGVIRLDLRRDLRIPVSVVRCDYPSTANSEDGLLVDATWTTRQLLPEGTAMRLTLTCDLPAGTGVTGTIYDASTHTALDTDGSGYFLTNAGQRHYYCRFRLTSTNGQQTPVLYGYNVDIEGTYRTVVTDPITVQAVTHVQVTGPGIDPTYEGASLAVSDLLDAYPILRTRDRIRSTVTILRASTEEVLSHLCEGEVTQPEAELRGTPDIDYPSPDWHEYPNLRLSGLWVRLAEQFAQSGPRNYAKDPLLPAGQNEPWKVTNVLHDLFNLCGFADDELDIPDLPFRLWTSQYYRLKPEDFALMYGSDFVSVIRKLAWDYLRMVIVRDPNAGERGMWRLLRNPQAPYENVVATFLLSAPLYLAGKAPHALASYPEATAYVRKGEWRVWTKAPECNVVTVWGVRQSDHSLLYQCLRNEASITGDPDTDLNPDYLGHELPVEFPPDPSLTDQRAVDWAARTIYDTSAHAQKWFALGAPLLLITDPQDTLQVRPRPLRINDLVTVGGFAALVRSVTIEYDKDADQRMHVEGLFL